jgi:hypothetical protein
VTTAPDATAPHRLSPRWRRRLAISGAVAGLLLALYALFGFLVAPGLLRQALEKDGSAFLRRRVSVAEVKVNPFTLTVDVNGLVVADQDASRLAAWEKLHVRLAPWRLLQGYAGVAEVRLTRPFFRAALDDGGRLNVQDLIGDDGSPPPPLTPGQERRRRLGVALDLLEVVEARVAFADATRKPRFETELGPLSFRLENFRTTGDTDSPYSLRGATEAGESFEWQGTLHSEPLRSAGTIAFTGLSLPKYGPYQVDQAPALLVERGTASVKARYALELGTGKRTFTVSGLTLLVEDLVLARRRDASRALEVPRLEVAGVDVDLLAKTAAVAGVKVTGGRISPRRERDGRMALLDMLETTPGPPSAWRWSVAEVAVEGLSVDAEDLMAPRPVRIALSEVKVTLTGLKRDPAVACPLVASFRWGEGGTVSVKGTLRPFAGSGELALEVAGLDLVPVFPYAADAVPLRMAAGTLGLKARTTFDASGAAARWTFAGDLRVDGLNLRHPVRDEDLVRWRALEVLGIDAASTRRAAARMVRLTEPRLRAVVFEDGTTGFTTTAGSAAGGGGADEAIAPDGAGGATEPASPADPAPATKRAPSGPPSWRTSIGLLQVSRGRVSLTDRSTRPPVHTALTDLEAKVVGLSSDPKVRSTVDVSARVDGAGSVKVSGTLNPLQQEAFTDLQIRTTGIDLTPLGPLAGKHLGYLIQKGKLDLELAWKVEERKVRAANVIRFDQFTLGDATDSTEATSLPVRLVLAILTDKDGVILLDVPVDGDLDDPTFRLGRAIWRTVKSLLVKVAASPFSALAALAGGGQEDLSLVDFAPGEARLEEAARKRIDLLARSLAARPRLGLELAGAVDPLLDGEALRRVELERLLRRTKGAAQRPPAVEESVTVPAEERPRWLAAALAAAAPPSPVPSPSPSGKRDAAPPDPAAMEVALLAAVTVPPEALPALATARAQAARDALLATGLDPARLYLVEGSERTRKEPGPRAYFGVR